MKNKQEAYMQQLMEHAALGDVLPDFDREGLWQSVAAGLQEERKPARRIPWLWLSHAAAVLLAVFVTYAWLRDKPAAPAPVIVRNMPAAAPASLSAATPAATASASLAHASGSNVLPAHRIPPPIPAAAAMSTSPLPVTGTAPEDPAPVQVVQTTEPSAQTAVAAVPKKVTHYLDIDPDAPGFDAPPAPPPALVQLKLNKPDAPAGQHSPLKEFALALGH